VISVSHFIVSAILFVFAGLVWRASSSRTLNRRFATFAISVALWATGVGGTVSGYYVDFWTRLAFAAGTFASVSFLSFIASYPPRDKWPSPSVLYFFFGVAAVTAVTIFTTNLIVFGPYVATSELRKETGPLYQVFTWLLIGAWMLAFALFVSRWRVARGRARTQLQYLGAGMVLPGGAVLITNVLWPVLTGRSTYGWVGPWFGLIFVAIVGHAIVRRRLTDLNLVVHRSLTVATAILLSALPVVALLALTWPRLLRQLDSVELGLLLGAVGVVTVLVPITRDVSNRVLDRYVYRTHANYQRTVREASQVLTQVLHLDQLLAFISTTVVRSTAAEGVALYLRDSAMLKCAAVEKAPSAEGFSAPSIAPQEVVTAVDAAGEPVLADEVARDREEHAAVLHDRLITHHWSLVLPVVSEDSLIAMIAVGPKLSGDAFYQQDIDLLMTLANQAGVAIKNAQLYAAVVVANEYLENIAAAIESGVVAINASGEIAMLNRAARHLTGITFDRPTAIGSSSLPRCLVEPLLATLADGDPRTLPEIDLPMTGRAVDLPSSRPVMCTTSAVRDPSGSVLGAVAVFSDLTPLKELEAERRQAERLAYFQALAAGIAHEIKNPLVAIKTFAQLLPRRRDDARFLDEFGRMSTREIERMQRLVDRFQNLSRPQGGPRSPVDLRIPLAEAIELIQPTLEEKNVRTSVALGTVPYFVIGNQGELEQVFLNLLLNAHDAMPNGGALTVELTSSDAQVIIAISDSGPGIPSNLLDQVFEPFFTTKARGSGLGLAISSGIAQAHGARLRASNRPGGGAQFTVEFPVSALTSGVTA
jgi:nitrogen-specific signal transduction histidine kinase